MRKTIVIGIALAFAIGDNPRSAEAGRFDGVRSFFQKLRPQSTGHQQRYKGALSLRAAGRRFDAATEGTFTDQAKRQGIAIGLRMMQAGAAVVGKIGNSPEAQAESRIYGQQASAISPTANAAAGVIHGAKGVTHSAIGGVRGIPGKIGAWLRSISKGASRTVQREVHQFEQRHPTAAANIEYGAKLAGAAVLVTGESLRGLGARIEQRAVQQYDFSPNAQRQLGVKGQSGAAAGPQTGLRPELQQLRDQMQQAPPAQNRIELGSGTSWRQAAAQLGLKGGRDSVKQKLQSMAQQGMVHFNNGRNFGGGGYVIQD